MEVGLNNYIKNIASQLYIKKGSKEQIEIDKSVDIIIKQLLEYYDDEVDEVILFGSYTRDTILPIKYDQNRDIDILVKFSNEYDILNPESYKNQLKKFAQLNYPVNSVSKNHPSIMIELDHIKFDLVPAIFEQRYGYEIIEIPDRDGGWMTTDPEKFNKELIKANTKYNSIVKPIVRLLKYWNASYGYPFYSFELEEQIIDINFSDDNIESGFLGTIDILSSEVLPIYQSKKVDVLKRQGEKVGKYLEKENLQEAKKFLHQILPNFS
jgi:predicted nucleotidyltransferase